MVRIWTDLVKDWWYCDFLKISGGMVDEDDDAAGAAAVCKSTEDRRLELTGN